jgi:anti-anti-sigma regulatory factor
MLRITVHDSPRALTFQVEGRLAGQWVRELEACWQSTLACRSKPTLCVDLTGVTFIDDAGRACLAALYRQGAEFVASDCLTRAVVAEITQAPEVQSESGLHVDRAAEREQAKRTYPRRDSHARPQSQAR